MNADMIPAPLTRTDIARLWREAYGGQQMDASAEDFARRVERAAIEASGHADLLAALQELRRAGPLMGEALGAMADAAITKATGGAA